MSGQGSESNEFVEYRRKRRARDDPMERNFVCNCGKSYLSYPALYTHIKNKHQGQAPPPGEFSSMNKSNDLRTTVRDDPENEHERHLSTSDDVLINIINTFRVYSLTRQFHYSVDDIFGVFPAEISKQIQENTTKFNIEKAPIEKILSNGIKAVTIDWIMGKFVALLLNKIDCKLLIEFVFILVIFRLSLNHAQHESVSMNEYTREASGLKMMEHANEFVLYYFDIYAGPFRSLIKEPCFIGNTKKELICLVKFMFLFGRWCFLDRYTNSKIKINNF